jgi:pilus assembly protein CpaB
MAAGFATIGLAAAFAGPWDRSSRSPAVAPPQDKTVMVLVASHPLPAGSLIGPDDISAKSVAAPAPVGAALTEADVVGRVTARRYAAKETISRSGLREAMSLGIAARVPPGKRAYAIRVGEDDIVGGFLQSGDRVDVIATIPGSVFPSKSAADVPDRSRTILLLQNISVLAVGENPTTRGSIQSGARTVSLALAPEGLARLALAERYGKVSLAIRTPSDTAESPTVSAVLADLVPDATPVRASSPEPYLAKRRRASGVPFYTGTRTTSLFLGGSR